MMRFVILFSLMACGGASAVPDSLQGTASDGALVFDDQGQLVVDADARRAFDYVLLAEGEVAEEQLEAWFSSRLVAADYTPSEVDAILATFAAYQRYRTQAAAILSAVDLSPATAQARLDEVRRTELGDTPLARDEAGRLARAFALREALAEPDPETRQSRMAAIRSPLSADFRASIGGRYLEARATVEAARASGASEVELREVRRDAYASFGPAAVARLEAQQVARAAFEARIADLRVTIDRLHAELPASAADAAVQHYIAEHFSEVEQRRVKGALRR